MNPRGRQDGLTQRVPLMNRPPRANKAKTKNPRQIKLEGAEKSPWDRRGLCALSSTCRAASRPDHAAFPERQGHDGQDVSWSINTIPRRSALS